MPDREEIIERLKNLSISESPLVTGVDYRDNQIWEKNESGAHFKVTKERIRAILRRSQSGLLPMPLPTLYSLSVSGERRGVRKVIKDFVGALGQPLDSSRVPGSPHIRTLAWNADKIDGKMN